MTGKYFKSVISILKYRIFKSFNVKILDFRECK